MACDSSPLGLGTHPTDNKPNRLSALLTQLSQTQPICVEPASSCSPPRALPGATPHSQEGTGPTTETKEDARGFSVGPWLSSREQGLQVQAAGVESGSASHRPCVLGQVT